MDLEAYLERIGLNGRPGLAELHRAHVTAVPFENLDPQGGLPVSLEPADLERKLVRERRGGYCFEQNLLLKAALEELGAEVDTLLARVRLGRPPDAVRPRSHLVLRVRHEGSTWHADAGFGVGTPLEPLPFGPGAVHEQGGWRFRIVEDGPELVLQQGAGEEEWQDLYGFLAEPVPHVDLETSNWFTSTHPRSPFVSGLIVSRQGSDGTRTTLSDWEELSLTVATPSETSTTPVERRDVPALIEERFGLPGYALREDGRLVRAAPTPRG